MELYKRFRPTSLKDVLGCPTTTAILQQMVANHTLPHTILFSGPSGCGKTTLARILKDALDCHDLDFKEMNSANYRGIDSIRDIQRNMSLAPQGGPVRVWLLDEVHKLSNDAQNAALKMWEDMPSHVYFFLCTTEPGKLLPTVRTRCADMPVKSLNQKELRAALERVCKKNKLDIAEGTLNACVDAAQGSARLALVILDKVRNLPQKDQQTAIEEAAAAENEAIDLCKALIDKKGWKTITGILKNIKGEPEDVRRAVIGFASWKLLQGENYQAYIVLDCFKAPFYDSGKPGLTLACFEAIKGQ